MSRQFLKVREMAVGIVNVTAVATSSQTESKQCGWLQTVSKHTRMQKHNEQWEGCRCREC